MFSQDGEVSTARLDAHVEDVDRYVSAASSPIRLGLRFALVVLQVMPLLLLLRAARLSSLPVDDRVALLARLERSTFAPLSLAFIGWRTVMTLVFYEDAGELARIGYLGGERHRYKRHLLTVPTPAESGVRLQNPASEALPAAGGEREVA